MSVLDIRVDKNLSLLFTGGGTKEMLQALDGLLPEDVKVCVAKPEVIAEWQPFMSKHTLDIYRGGTPAVLITNELIPVSDYKQSFPDVVSVWCMPLVQYKSGDVVQLLDYDGRVSIQRGNVIGFTRRCPLDGDK